MAYHAKLTEVKLAVHSQSHFKVINVNNLKKKPGNTGPLLVTLWFY